MSSVVGLQNVGLFAHGCLLQCWQWQSEKHAVCQTSPAGGRNAVTHCHAIRYCDPQNSRRQDRRDNSPRLIWMLFANPDTSTSYVEVASRSALWRFCHRRRDRIAATRWLAHRRCRWMRMSAHARDRQSLARSPIMTFFARTHTAALLVAVLAIPAAAHAQTAWHEGFEGPQPSWRDAGGNAQYRVLQHQRLQGNAHTGNGCEWLQIEGDGGSHVYFAHDVGRPRIIDELAPSVWIKSDRPGPHLAVRVVLPRTIDPRSGRPVATILTGAAYTDVGRWQQLQLGRNPHPADPPNPRPAHAARAAGRRPRSLSRRRAAERLRRAGRDQRLDRRSRSGRARGHRRGQPPLSGHVRLPPARHRARRWCPSVCRRFRPTGRGDRSFPPDGRLGIRRDGPVAPASDPAPRRTVKLVGSVLLVDGRPMFPRVIQHRGEPLAVLKKIGFNAVWLQRLPAPELLEEADRLGLWLICPPPRALTPIAEIGPAFDSVLAWDLGNDLTEADLEADAALGRTGAGGRSPRQPAAGLPPADRPARLQPAGRPAADRPPAAGHESGDERLRHVGPPAAVAGQAGHARLDHRADAAQRGVAPAACSPWSPAPRRRCACRPNRSGSWPTRPWPRAAAGWCSSPIRRWTRPTPTRSSGRWPSNCSTWSWN